MQIFRSFYDGKVEQQICYSFTLPWILNQFKMVVHSFRLHQVFPTLMVSMIFSQIQQAPGPDFRKVGKSLNILVF